MQLLFEVRLHKLSILKILNGGIKVLRYDHTIEKLDSDCRAVSSPDATPVVEGPSLFNRL